MGFVGQAIAGIGGGQAAGGLLGGIAGVQSGGPVDTAATGAQAKEAYLQQQQALDAQKSFLMALQAQGGIGNQTAVFQQQQQLAQQLQAQAMGQGPNPVQAQLAQATGANTANQAALMAGQRGASANAGMMARQAANVGAANQQAMVGQAGTLGAQQQLAAQQALMGQQQNMAGLSSQMVGQQQQGLQTQGSMALQGQSNVLNALTSQNQMNAGIEQGNLSRRGQLIGGLMQAGGSAAMMAMGGGGGKAAAGTTGSNFAHGGMVGADGGPRSAVGRYFMNKGGMVDAGKETVVIPSAGGHGSIIWIRKDGQPEAGMANGGPVPGQAPVPGDSLKNDTVPTMLSPGEIVIPRSVLQGDKPADAAKKFVEAVLARHGKPK